ncbi:MAG: PEP-utilizing enzyme [Firmicutes bacterium]|nr:PEP-utilizing enzyme [Bacillota bacterium]MCL5013966.1 PEP-utilizing enzyme [Bacillota bacterium]
MRYQAQVLAPGTAQGPCFLTSDPHIAQMEKKQEDWRAARLQAVKALTQMQEELQDKASKDIVQAQILMLEDPEWTSRIEALVASNSPANAIIESAEEFAASLEQLTDPYLQQRARDIRDVAGLWCRFLREKTLSQPPGGSIVITKTLTVHDVVHWAEIGIHGIVCELGTPLMHASLVAQNLGIPVVALPQALSLFEAMDGSEVLVDGDAGSVFINKTEQGNQRSVAPETVPKTRLRLSWKGQRLQIFANVSSVAEAARSHAFDAEGIGLVRTEFLLESAGHLLGLEEQTALYRDILRQSPGPTIFRTFDLGSDKALSFWPIETHEPNPALGTRGVRLYYLYPELLRTQLTALAMAGQGPGGVSVMFPMVKDLEDWQHCRRVASDVLSELGLPPFSLHLGVMLEVPSLGFLLPELAANHAEFVSIGSNDLYQYFSATDRERSTPSRPQVDLPKPSISDTSPGERHNISSADFALARFLAYISEQAGATGLPLSVCGQLATHNRWALLFTALKMFRLSVPAPAIPPLKAYLFESFRDLPELESEAAEALSSWLLFARWMEPDLPGS